MDSPPIRPKPIPSHLANGPLSPLRLSQEARDRRERDNLYAAIETSNRGRQVVNFDDGPGADHTNIKPLRNGHTKAHAGDVDAEAYGASSETAAKTPLATSRAHSPYTQHPAIDFDGMSWPSR